MHPPRRPDVPISAIGAMIQPESIDVLLARWVPDAEERAFVIRCILETGPVHHRGANYVLLLLLARVLEAAAVAGPAGGEPDETMPIPMRLPAPHRGRHNHDVYPLRMSLAPLRKLAAGDERVLSAMIDCLTDGPPQHALANAAMVNALGLLLSHPKEPAR